MAKCYQMTPAQTADWDQGGWLSLELEDTVIEWADRHAPHQEVIAVTSDHKIAFALTAQGVRA